MGQGFLRHAWKGFFVSATPSDVRPGKTLEGCGPPAKGEETLILGFTWRDKAYLVSTIEWRRH
jgi:hypothetical protein